MTFDPSAYGITNEMSTGNLLTAINTYQTLVEKLAGTATPAAELEKVVSERIRKDATVSGNVTAMISEVRDHVLGTLFRNPEMSVQAYDDLKDLLTDVKNLRDYHVAKVAKGSKVALPLDKTTEDNRTAAVSLRSFIDNLYSFLSTAGKNWPGFDSEEFAKVPTKKGEKSGNVLLDLPRVPGTKSSSNGNVGRGVAYRIAEYSVFIGNECHQIPKGTHLKDVLISYGSDTVHGVMTVTKLQEMLKEDGQEISATPGHMWSITLPNGNVLESVVPEDVSSEDDSDDDE